MSRSDWPFMSYEGGVLSSPWPGRGFALAMPALVSSATTTADSSTFLIPHPPSIGCALDVRSSQFRTVLVPDVPNTTRVFLRPT